MLRSSFVTNKLGSDDGGGGVTTLKTPSTSEPDHHRWLVSF